MDTNMTGFRLFLLFFCIFCLVRKEPQYTKVLISEIFERWFLSRKSTSIQIFLEISLIWQDIYNKRLSLSLSLSLSRVLSLSLSLILVQSFASRGHCTSQPAGFWFCALPPGGPEGREDEDCPGAPPEEGADEATSSHLGFASIDLIGLLPKTLSISAMIAGVIFGMYWKIKKVFFKFLNHFKSFF